MVMTLADYQCYAMACQKKANSAHAETRPFWLEATNSWLFLANVEERYEWTEQSAKIGLQRRIGRLRKLTPMVADEVGKS